MWIKNIRFFRSKDWDLTWIVALDWRCFDRSRRVYCNSSRTACAGRCSRKTCPDWARFLYRSCCAQWACRVFRSCSFRAFPRRFWRVFSATWSLTRFAFPLRHFLCFLLNSPTVPFETCSYFRPLHCRILPSAGRFWSNCVLLFA